MRHRLPLAALQKAVFARLSGDLTETVGNYIAEGTKFPYVQIGRFNSANAQTKDSGLVSVSYLVEIWSESTGAKETNELANKVIDSLTRAALSLDDNFTDVLRRFEGAENLLEDFGGRLIQHSTLRFAWTLQDLTSQP